MFLNWLIILWTFLPASFAEDQPQFKFGHESLTKFIARSMIYPEYSKYHCLEGTIQVSFKLDRAGNIVNSKIHHGYGTDLDKEALRIVRLTSHRWVVPDSYDTNTEMILPISFSLNEYKCDQQSPDDISKAISDYKAQEDLTRAIVNFYQKKSSGVAVTKENEQEIAQLKTELGYDSRFIDRLLKQGIRKLKQNDRDGACEDFRLDHGLGSSKPDALIAKNCR